MDDENDYWKREQEREQERYEQRQQDHKHYHEEQDRLEQEKSNYEAFQTMLKKQDDERNDLNLAVDRYEYPNDKHDDDDKHEMSKTTFIDWLIAWIFFIGCMIFGIYLSNRH